MNDPTPIIEPDTLRGAREIPLTPHRIREHTTTRDHTPFTTLDHIHGHDGNQQHPPQTLHSNLTQALRDMETANPDARGAADTYLAATAHRKQRPVTTTPPLDHYQEKQP